MTLTMAQNNVGHIDNALSLYQLNNQDIILVSTYFICLCLMQNGKGRAKLRQYLHQDISFNPMSYNHVIVMAMFHLVISNALSFGG